MYFQQLLRNIPRSKLVRRSTLVLLSLFPIALAFTVGADRSETTNTGDSAGSTSLANAPLVTAAWQETAPLLFGAGAGTEDQTYLPELSAYSEDAPSVEPAGDATTEAFAFENASNAAEGSAGLEDQLGLSEFLQAKVHPASTLYGASLYGAYGSISGRGSSPASNFPTTGGMPDLNAGGGVKTYDPLDPLGVADIPSNTGLYVPSHPTSVPEPETWALWVIGMMGCFLSRRRTTRTS